MNVEDLLDKLWIEPSYSPLTEESEFSDEVSTSCSQVSCHINTQLDYITEVDRKKQCITLKDRDNTLIWVVWRWTFRVGNIRKQNHLYKKIERAYRWKWYGTILMDEYIKAWFELPDFEYTWKIEAYCLLCKFWYTFFSLIEKKSWREYPLEENPSLKEIKTLLEKWYVIWLIKSDFT